MIVVSFAAIVIAVVAAGGGAMAFSQWRTNRNIQTRELAFKRRMVELENRKAKALHTKDDFEVFAADQEMIRVRERYALGKGPE